MAIRGRPRLPKWRRKIPHGARPAHDANTPVHVTMTCERSLPSLRCFVVAREIGRAFHGLKARGRGVVQFSIQQNHLHLIAEAPDRQALLANLRGIAIALAKAINRATRRKGRVFDDRYHLKPLCDPSSVRAALVYVLMNHKRHGVDEHDIDPMSSARWFDGFRTRQPRPLTPAPVSPATTALLRERWRRQGLISVAAMPNHSKPGPREFAALVSARN